MTKLRRQCTPPGREGLAGWFERALDAAVDPGDRRVVRALARLAGGSGTRALGAQVAVDERLLGRLTPANIDRVVRWEGRHHLDEALARGRGVVLMFPHAGFQKGLIARLGLSGYTFTQVALRGLPPGERVEPAVSARIAAREAREDRLPVRFHDQSSPTRGLLRDLAANGVVGLAYDGRGGGKFALVAYLGRPAYLATGPWRLAVAAGSPVVPAFVRLDGRVWTAAFGAPYEPGLDPDALRDRVLREVFEPWLRRYPDHYAPWIAHCARHAERDNHPLFPE